MGRCECVFFQMRFSFFVKIHCLNWTISKSILMLRFCCINRAVRSSALHQIENLISTIWNLSIFEPGWAFLLFGFIFWGQFCEPRRSFITPWLYDCFWHGLLFNFKVYTLSKQTGEPPQASGRTIPISNSNSICFRFRYSISILSNVWLCRFWHKIYSDCESIFFSPLVFCMFGFDRNNKWIFDVIACPDCGIRINL